MGLIAHIRRLWPNGWWWCAIPLAAWPFGVLVITRQMRWELVALIIVVLGLAYGNAWSKRLFVGIYPIGVLGVIYDAMRYVKNVGVTPDRIHICDLRALDMRIWSANVGGTQTTVHDWLQLHHTPALDFLCAAPYGFYIFAALAFAVFLYVKDYEDFRLFSWTFLLLNIAGFVTYHLYPAAPPWYFHTHGCTLDLTAHANEGPNLARVDAMLGFHYFEGMYGRSSDVFGAMPSLHIAYPTLILLFGWPYFRLALRGLVIAFMATMYFAAVYLDHHWIIDVICGLAYTLAFFAGALYVKRARREGVGLLGGPLSESPRLPATPQFPDR